MRMGSYCPSASSTRSCICNAGEEHVLLLRAHRYASQRRKPWVQARIRLHSRGLGGAHVTRAVEEEVEEPLEEEEDEEFDAGIYRPWSFNLPTIQEMAAEDWPEKVADWRMFWVMFDQWLYVQRQLGRKKYARLTKPYLAWLGLEFETPEVLEEHLSKAVNSVKERMPELKDRLVPLPLVVQSDTYGTDVGDPLHVEDVWVRYKEEEEEEEEPQPPWDSWDDWDFRAWMEKRRQAEVWHQDFLRRQDLVGKYPSLNVTDGNDSRFAAKAEVPYRMYSVEEVIDLITQGGRSVHPDKIPLRPEDPLAPADWYKEGVHYVQDTEDYIRSIGHWAESESELIQIGEAVVGDEGGGPVDPLFAGANDDFGDDEDDDVDGGFDDDDD